MQTNSVMFKIEEVPAGINLLEKIKFKRTLRKTINGHILAQFDIKEYLICLYTLDKDNASQINFIKKINFLRSLIQGTILNELWVVHDRYFMCIGILLGAPIFIRNFDSVRDTDDNLSLMIRGINSFGVANNIRFFACVASDFADQGLSIFEYSDLFMTSAMNGHTSLTQFVQSRNENPSISAKNIYKVALPVALCLFGFGCLLLDRYFSAMIESIQKDLLKFNASQIPTKEHHGAIMKILLKSNQ